MSLLLSDFKGFLTDNLVVSNHVFFSQYNELKGFFYQVEGGIELYLSINLSRRRYLKAREFADRVESDGHFSQISHKVI